MLSKDDRVYTIGLVVGVVVVAVVAIIMLTSKREDDDDTKSPSQGDGDEASGAPTE